MAIADPRFTITDLDRRPPILYFSTRVGESFKTVAWTKDELGGCHMLGFVVQGPAYDDETNLFLELERLDPAILPELNLIFRLFLEGLAIGH